MSCESHDWHVYSRISTYCGYTEYMRCKSCGAVRSRRVCLEEIGDNPWRGSL